MAEQIQIILPVEQATRMMTILMASTDRYYMDRNRAGSPEHKSAICADQEIYRQVTRQTTIRDINKLMHSMGPEELKDVLPLIS